MKTPATYKSLCICLVMETYLHAMFFSTKMLQNYAFWSSHPNIAYGASIITNFFHSQKRSLHDLNYEFRYNFGLQQFVNCHCIAHVVHPENLVDTNLFYINYTGPPILYIGKFYTIFDPFPAVCNILLFQWYLTPPLPTS
jgi:hypothetical protein